MWGRVSLVVSHAPIQRGRSPRPRKFWEEISSALEAVGFEWRYAVLVVQERNDNDDDDDDDDDDCIGSTLKLSRVLSRMRDIFIETLNKNFTEFFNVSKFREILHQPVLVRIF